MQKPKMSTYQVFSDRNRSKSNLNSANNENTQSGVRINFMHVQATIFSHKIIIFPSS